MMAKKTEMAEVAGKSLRLERRKVADLIVYENNPRIIEDAVPLVAESIRQCGYITPIVIDEDGVILAGHTRLAALKETGADECEVIVAEGLTDEQRRKYRLLDNKTGEIASWDKAKLREEIADLDFNGFDFGQCDILPGSFEEFDEEDGDGDGTRKQRTVICPRCKAEVPA